MIQDKNGLYKDEIKISVVSAMRLDLGKVILRKEDYKSFINWAKKSKSIDSKHFYITKYNKKTYEIKG